MTIQSFSIPWYQRTKYDRLRQISVDGEKLHATYKGWLRAATALESRMKESGADVHRVEIDPEDFVLWCEENDLSTDAHARTLYATSVTRAEVLFHEAAERGVAVARAVTDIVSKSVVPIFTYRSLNLFDFEGSGTLCRLDDKYYLITAAHVLDACTQGVYLLEVEGGSRSLVSSHIVTAPPPGGMREHDSLDVGFVRLTNDEVLAVGADRFLDLSQTGAGEDFETATVTIAVGYPKGGQSINARERTVDTAVTMYMTGLEMPLAYKMARANPQTHLLLRYRRDEMVYNRKRTGPAGSFKGMSGGGVWPVRILEDPETPTIPPLAGIIVEQPVGYGPSILATRAAVVRAFIRKFDE